MSLAINTNTAAITASYHLGKNNSHLQKSLTRLSSGSRITEPSDDAGGLAVSVCFTVFLKATVAPGACSVMLGPSASVAGNNPSFGCIRRELSNSHSGTTVGKRR